MQSTVIRVGHWCTREMVALRRQQIKGSCSMSLMLQKKVIHPITYSTARRSSADVSLFLLLIKGVVAFYLFINLQDLRRFTIRTSVRAGNLDLLPIFPAT